MKNFILTLLLFLSGITVTVFSGCGPYNDVHAIVSNSDFIFMNESGKDLKIAYVHFSPLRLDSNILVPDGYLFLLHSSSVKSLTHPFPTTCLSRIDAYEDSAGSSRLVYTQNPVQDDNWEHIKVNNFYSKYILRIKEADLLK